VSGIVWLASWPKSGNTWVRAFIANLRRGDRGPANINDLQIPTAANRQLFDETAGVEASDLTAEEIARLRPRVYRQLAEESEGTVFLKIHDACGPVVPADVTAGAIYIMRNPLDVTVSFAHHMSKPIDWSIAEMASSRAGYYSDLPIRNLNQQLGTWSSHVSGWVDQRAFPVHVVRYEDLHDNPLEAFTVVATCCGLQNKPNSVQRAIGRSSFEVLQRQEFTSGFRERPEKLALFFRQGRVGAWREVLSPSQVARIIDDHGPVMERFGYLPL
jgi:aryl sulfotransferase